MTTQQLEELAKECLGQLWKEWPNGNPQEHDKNIIASFLHRAVEMESNDWERWAREVCTDFRIPFDDHKVGLRMAITQWMAEKMKEDKSE